MNEVVRQTLAKIIERHARPPALDVRCCEGLLRDYLHNENKKEISILVAALREQVVADLLASGGTMPERVLLIRCTRKLQDRTGIAEELARWSIESWPLALGVIPAWYYTLDRRNRIGLLSAAELIKLADTGQLSPDHFVWKEGRAKWIQARALKGLFLAAVPCPAPAEQPASPSPAPSSAEPHKQVQDVRDPPMTRQAIVQSDGEEESLRPRWLREVVGQKAIVQRLNIVLNSCKCSRKPAPHILFDGPPGMGKTTFATVLTNELGTSIQMTSGPALRKPPDLLPFLTNVEEGSALFIDEIHRMPRVVEEFIYPAMEDFRLDIVLGEGMNARTINLRLKPFSLIGATTRSGMLSGPMRDRFKMHEHLEYYSVEELAEIVRINARKLQTPLGDDAALELATRSRGTPRVANARLWWARHYATSEADGHITLEVARAALDMAEVDRDGLDKQDRRYLELLVGVHSGGPAGVESLAASMTLPVDTLSDEIEPYLLREQFIVRTSRGRVATARAYQILGRPMKPAPPEDRQPGLFD